MHSDNRFDCKEFQNGYVEESANSQALRTRLLRQFATGPTNQCFAESRD